MKGKKIDIGAVVRKVTFCDFLNKAVTDGLKT